MKIISKAKLEEIKLKLLDFQRLENALGAQCLRLAFHDCVGENLVKIISNR